MGRRPIGDGAMSGAERQRRYMERRLRNAPAGEMCCHFCGCQQADTERLVGIGERFICAKCIKTAWHSLDEARAAIADAALRDALAVGHAVQKKQDAARAVEAARKAAKRGGREPNPRPRRIRPPAQRKRRHSRGASLRILEETGPL